MGGHGLDSSGSIQGQVICFCGRGNETLASIQCGKLLSSWGGVKLLVRNLYHRIGWMADINSFSDHNTLHGDASVPRSTTVQATSNQIKQRYHAECS